MSNFISNLGISNVGILEFRNFQKGTLTQKFGKAVPHQKKKSKKSAQIPIFHNVHSLNHSRPLNKLLYELNLFMASQPEIG